MKISVEDIPKIGYYSDMEDKEYSVGVAQMIYDLYELAKNDGCVSAAWTLELLSELFPVKDEEN